MSSFIAVFAHLFLRLSADQRAGIRFDVGVAPPEILLQALLSAGASTRFTMSPTKPVYANALLSTAPSAVYHEPRGDQSHVGDLMVIALVSVGIFFMHNGFLLSGLILTVRSFPAKSPAWH